MSCTAAVKTKLQSENGATILVALLFFLMCAMVGSVILAAATVSAGRSGQTLSDEDRVRYSLRSAAKVIEAQSKSADTGLAQLQMQWEKEGTAADWTATDNSDAGTNDNIFLQLRRTMAKQVVASYEEHLKNEFNGFGSATPSITDWSLVEWNSFQKKQTPPDLKIKAENISLTLADETGIDSSNLLPVSATAEMDGEFNLTVTLTCDTNSLKAESQRLKNVTLYVYFAENGFNLHYSSSSEGDAVVKQTITLRNEWKRGEVLMKDPNET